MSELRPMTSILFPKQPAPFEVVDSEAREGVRQLSEEIAFKPEQYGLPILYLTGDTSAMTKDVAVDLAYVYGTRSGTCSVKWQGSSSLSYPKKNYTVKFDEAFEAVEGWGAQKKYCFKANFIDHSHARNVVCAKLWGGTVKSRSDVPAKLSSLPNAGAIDGFPCVIMLNGEFHGLYTWNIPKDGWMYGMNGETQTEVAETLDFDTYINEMANPATGAYEPASGVTAYSVKKRSTVSDGRAHFKWDQNKLGGFGVRGYLYDADGKLVKIFSATVNGVHNPVYGLGGGDFGEKAWMDVGTTGNPMYPTANFSVPVPAGHTIQWEIALMANMSLPDGTLTKTWSSEAEANNTWVYTWIKTGLETTITREVLTPYEQAAIVCADTTSEATRFLKPAVIKEGVDFELEHVSDEDNADWVLTSLNRLINACINSDGSDLDTTIAQYLDWNSAIDYYVYACLVGGADMAGKNYILYTYDGTKWGFGAYDMDSTFGLWWNGKTFLRENKYPTIQWYADYHRAMKLILTHKKDALKARYAELRAGVLSEGSVAEAFSNFIAQIPAAVYTADAEKWPTIPSTAANNLYQILNWYRMRVEVLDAEVDAL